MAKLVFKLRHVGEDEAMDIRSLLATNDIEFHETTGGLLGLSVPGLWVVNDEQSPQAFELIHQYQQERMAKNREQPLPSFWHMFYKNPILWLRNVLLIAAVLVLTFLPVWWLLYR